MRSTTTTLQQLEWNADGVSADEISPRILNTQGELASEEGGDHV